MSKDMSVFDQDENGNIVTCPLTGWNIMPVAGAVALCQLSYVKTPEDLATDKAHRIQLVMTPQQALELGETLQRQAKHLLTPDPSAPVQ